MAAETANPNALPEAKAIMRYFRRLPSKAGKRVISGQFESWNDDVKPLSDPHNNLTQTHAKTGKWVGLVGVEYLMRSADAGDFAERPNRLCSEYWRKGGLVQIYLIMRNPAAPDSNNGGGRCDIDLVLDPQHPFHRFFFAELDRVADALAALQQEGVVVLLNPFAEITADWFWWAGEEPEKCRQLYRATFDYLTRTRRLNNLLFVFEPSGYHDTATAYYPGDAYVDVVGISCFVPWDKPLTPASIPAYEKIRSLGKPLALSQWGPRRGVDQVGHDEPPGDNLKLLEGIQAHFPEITWWMNWNFAYAIASGQSPNLHATELLDHAWVVNLDDLAWRARSEPATTKPPDVAE